MLYGKFQIKYLAASILIMFLMTGCGVRTWTAQELTNWYTSNVDRSPAHYSPLYYRGSNENYHYFIYRVFDSFVNVKVKRDEIEIDEVKPAIGIFGKPFPGYYSVDPNDNYNRIDNLK